MPETVASQLKKTRSVDQTKRNARYTGSNFLLLIPDSPFGAVAGAVKISHPIFKVQSPLPYMDMVEFQEEGVYIK